MPIAAQLAAAEAALEQAHKAKNAIIRESRGMGGWSDQQWDAYRERIRAAEAAETAAQDTLKELLERYDELFL